MGMAITHNSTLSGKKTKKDSSSDLKKAASASFIGNFVEWFDYASYGYLAVVISTVFFPAGNAKLALIATFAVFAMSFIARPIGGVVWGHIGDKFGRKNALSLSILIMSGATFLIALLPSYAAIGVAAPLLLLFLRIVQGFSASGEYAGAATFLVEYAPDDKRGLYGSIVPASTAAGLLFGSLFVTVLYAVLTPEQLASWGWRIPFLLAAPFGLIGRYIRVHLEDSPKFREFSENQKSSEAPVPFRSLINENRRELLIAFGVVMLNAVGFYTLLSYMPTYLATELGMNETTSFMLSSVTLLIYIGLIFLMGTLSDRFGRKRMLSLACILFMVFTIPAFMLIDTKSVVLVALGQAILVTLLAMNDGNLASFLSEIFPTHNRYSGFAISFNGANALFGGTAPLIATWMIAMSGDILAPGYYLVIAAAIALVAMHFSKETAGAPLQE